MKAVQVYEQAYMYDSRAWSSSPVLPTIRRSLTRFSHTTSFLPLTVALVALVSRLRLLIVELDDIVRGLWDNLFNLIHVLDVSY